MRKPKVDDAVIITEIILPKASPDKKHIKEKTIFAIVEISDCECMPCEGCPTKEKYILAMNTKAEDGAEDEFVSLCGCKFKKA